MSQSQPPVTIPPADSIAPLEKVLCTDELRRRPSRPPNFSLENRALSRLAQAHADSPDTILQTLVETIMEVCGAGSAGISLLKTDERGTNFHWPAIAGEWKRFIGGYNPRNFSPCGDVLDLNRPLLFRDVESRYPYFAPIVPRVEEALLVPFYICSEAAGTIWAIHHDTEHRFDAEDQRMLESLSKLASSAYQTHLTLQAIKSQAEARESSAIGNNWLASIVDSSDDIIVSKSLGGTITSWNKAAERVMGYSAAEAIGSHITLIIPEERHSEEFSILERIKRGERVDHFETVRRRKDGSLVDLSLTISPVKDSTGRVVGASKIARDITVTKNFERVTRENEDRLRALAATLEDQVRARTAELMERSVAMESQAEQLRALSTQLLASQDDERRRIARELHDSAGQIIAALSMNLAGLETHAKFNPPLSSALEDTQDLLRQLNREIRTTSYLLHPPLLDETGLPGALRWYIDGIKKRSGLDVEFLVADDFDRLPADIELTLFRIVQESITNIHRHSGSSRATIRLTRHASSVQLEVQDYGKGLPPESAPIPGVRPRSGVGMMGMRERVRHIGGKLTIESGPSGTTVCVKLPVSDAADSTVAAANS
jgi:PAS domain S-box-containing protein